MFHFGLVAGATAVISAGTFVIEKIDGKTNEEALESSKKVLGSGIKFMTLGMRQK